MQTPKKPGLLPKGYSWRECLICHEPFAAKRKDARWCSRTCRWRRDHSYRLKHGKAYDPTPNLPWYQRKIKLSGSDAT